MRALDGQIGAGVLLALALRAAKPVQAQGRRVVPELAAAGLHGGLDEMLHGLAWVVRAAGGEDAADVGIGVVAF